MIIFLIDQDPDSRIQIRGLERMREFGIDDGETGDLELQARRHLKMVLDWMTAS